MNEVKNKKGDTVKVVLIIVLLILLIASMSFTVYDKFIKKDNKVNNQQTEEKDNAKNDTVTDENKITFKGVQNDHMDGGIFRDFFETNNGYVRITSDDLNLNIEFYNSSLEFDDEDKVNVKDYQSLNKYLLNTIKVKFDNCPTNDEPRCSINNGIVVHDNIITFAYNRHSDYGNKYVYYLKSVDLDGNSIFEVEIPNFEPNLVLKMDYKDGLYYVFDRNLIWKTYDKTGQLKNSNVYETVTYRRPVEFGDEGHTFTSDAVIALNNDNTFSIFEPQYNWDNIYYGTYTKTGNNIVFNNFKVFLTGKIEGIDVKDKTATATLKDDSLIINEKEYKLVK